MNTKRNYYQFIRGLCVLMVILIHTLYITDSFSINIINVIIRRLIDFAVPVFIFLAGYFFKYQNFQVFFRKKFTRIVMPFIIWKLIYGVIEIILRKPSFGGAIKIIVTAGFHLYYLAVLTMLFIISPLLIRFINKQETKVKLYFPLATSFLFNLLITIFYIKTGKAFPFYNYHIFGWFSYYYLGILLNLKKIKLKDFKISLVLFICCLVSVAEGIYIYCVYNIYDLAVTQLTFSNCIFSMFICLFINRNDNEIMKKNIVITIGDYSYGIYLSHVLILSALNKVFCNWGLPYFLDILFKYISTCFITYILCYIYYDNIKNILVKKSNH